MPVSFIGIDMAFANMGLVRGIITDDLRIVAEDIQLISTTALLPGPWESKVERKHIRKSSTDLRRAKELVAAIHSWAFDAQIAFAEVPSGSQSATAARALGIAVGCLASCPIPILEVTPYEVKMASTGNRQGTKQEVIEWAMRVAPNLPWRYSTRKKEKRIAACNEHMADALATVAAGILTPDFQRLWKLIPHAIPRTTDVRPALHVTNERQIPLELTPVARRRVRVRVGSDAGDNGGSD